MIASLPLTALLAFIWLYYDTRDKTKVIELSYGVFWLVIPSLAFFLLLPLFLKQGLKFWLALPLAALATSGVYFLFMGVLRKLGVNI